MAWPPNPDKSPNNHQNHHATKGREWHLLEKTLLASIEEQKRARRWNIFFKLITFAYVLIVIGFLGRACSSESLSHKPITTAAGAHLAVVDVQGVIANGSAANAEDVIDALTNAFENSNSEAVALNINSPGGSPVQSDEIWQAMMSLKKEHPNKKLYAVIGDIGASGAYYIASAADEIWVNPASLVGSIGVIMPNYGVQGLLDKIGVEDRTLTAGAHKNILSMSKPLDEAERVHVENVLADTHQTFIDAVVQGRGDRLKNIEENQLFSGLFWTGKQSIDLGLADELGGIPKLKKTLELDTTVNYTPKDPVRMLFDSFGVQMGKGLGAGLNLAMSEQQNTPSLK